MDAANGDSDEVKALALDGNFDLITEKFGIKKCGKAENYAQAKLDSLREKVQRGQSLSSVLYATPFMTFALDHTDKKLIEVAKLFKAGTEEEPASSQLSSEISASQSNKNASQPSAAKVNEPPRSTPPGTSVSVVTPLRGPSSGASKAKGFQAPAVNADIINSGKKAKSSTAEKSQKAKGDRKSDKPEKGKKESGKKAGKAEKLIKDPNAPKGAKGGYMFFSSHMRSEILGENPGLGCVEVAKETGARWKALSEEEKQPFLDQAMADKQRYDEEMATYRAENPDFKTAARKQKSSGTKDGAKDKVNGKTDKSSRPKVTSKHNKRMEAESDAEEEKPAADSQAEVNGTAEGADREDAAEEDEMSQQPSQEDSVRAAGKRKAAVVAEKGIRKSVKGVSHAPLQRPEKKQRTSGHSGGESKLARAKAAQDPQDEDLSNTEFEPFATCQWPAPMEFPKGAAVTLVPAPYRTFLSQLPADCVDAHTRQEIQRVCSTHSSDAVVHCVVKSARSIAKTEEDEDGAAQELRYTLLTVAVAGREYKVLHADLSSPLLTADVFLLHTKQYKESLQAPHLVINAQVRRLFSSEDPAVAEWQEGSVYHIREDLERNPYGAVKIAWLRQEKRTGDWVYAHMQTDCDCSPWELELSSYVLLQNVRPPKMPRTLLVGTLDPVVLIEFLKTFDAAEQFDQDMSKCQNADYCAMFPAVEERWDLPRISRLCRQGRYSDDADNASAGSGSGSGKHSLRGGGAHLGILALFQDLARMVQQSKRYNACNAAFLPWRLADMMECAVQRLKRVLAEERGIVCLQNSLREDQREMLQQAEDAQAVDV